jgi:hypothetical protein
MRRRRNKRYVKKSLCRREKQLDEHLARFLDGFDSKQAPDEESNYRLLLNLRWMVNDFIYLRLKLNRAWKKNRFLDLFDVAEVKATSDSVELKGDIVWWAEGVGANLEWVPADHEPHPTGVYKVKIRGDMKGGRWVVEPVTARLRRAKVRKRNAVYSVEFGRGSTYMKIESRVNA